MARRAIISLQDTEIHSIVQLCEQYYYAGYSLCSHVETACTLFMHTFFCYLFLVLSCVLSYVISANGKRSLKVYTIPFDQIGDHSCHNIHAGVHSAWWQLLFLSFFLSVLVFFLSFSLFMAAAMKRHDRQGQTYRKPVPCVEKANHMSNL